MTRRDDAQTPGAGRKPAAIGDLPPARIHQELDRILASATFQRVERLKRFIGFIVGETVSGRGSDGQAITTTLSTGVRSGGAFAARSESALDPRLAVLFRASSALSFTASAYRAFRAPTLNELYRAFRVGNVSTLANASLRAETFEGIEGGLAYENRRRGVRVRGALFQGRVRDPIVNATLSVTPDLTTRQRQNLGANRSLGFESELQWDPSAALSISVSYLFSRARVDDAPANRALEGLDLPQSPRHQVTAQARYTGPGRLRLSLQARGSGRQFDDDQNLLSLRGYAVVDALATGPLARRFDVFVAGENILNRSYETGRSGVTTIGAPRAWRAGVRYGFR